MSYTLLVNRLSTEPIHNEKGIVKVKKFRELKDLKKYILKDIIAMFIEGDDFEMIENFLTKVNKTDNVDNVIEFYKGFFCFDFHYMEELGLRFNNPNSYNDSDYIMHTYYETEYSVVELMEGDME